MPSTWSEPGVASSDHGARSLGVSGVGVVEQWWRKERSEEDGQPQAKERKDARAGARRKRGKRRRVAVSGSVKHDVAACVVEDSGPNLLRARGCNLARIGIR